MDPAPGGGRRLGFLQLCADRRYHRKTMAAFVEHAGLEGPEAFWIEASAGGAPAFDVLTETARFAHRQGAVVMGWAAHGDGCGGFPGIETDEVFSLLETMADRRLRDLPDVEHWLLFGAGGEVTARRL